MDWGWMDWGWMAAVSGFALAMAGTPGPNNTIATACGARYGFRRTLPLMAGMALGVAAIILAVAAFGTSLVADPRVRTAVKWAGLAYLLWLAWRIGTARPVVKGSNGEGSDPAGEPLGPLHGALFQLVNPKLWAMVAGAVATFGGAASTASPAAIALVFAAIFGTATFASTAAWTLVGALAGRILVTECSMRRFNLAMAGLLVLSLLPVLAE